MDVRDSCYTFKGICPTCNQYWWEPDLCYVCTHIAVAHLKRRWGRSRFGACSHPGCTCQAYAPEEVASTGRPG